MKTSEELLIVATSGAALSLAAWLLLRKKQATVNPVSVFPQAASVPASAPAGVASAPVATGNRPPTIRKGSSGQWVTTWQNFLGEPTSGTFSDSLVFMTKQYQSSHGLVADGIVGPKTWAKAGY